MFELHEYIYICSKFLTNYFQNFLKPITFILFFVLKYGRCEECYISVFIDYNHIKLTGFILINILLRGYCTPLAVDCGRDNSTGIAGTLATGEQARHGNMLQGVVIANNAYG